MTRRRGTRRCGDAEMRNVKTRRYGDVKTRGREDAETRRPEDVKTRSKRSCGWLELVMMSQLDVKPGCIVGNIGDPGGVRLHGAGKLRRYAIANTASHIE